MTANEKSAGRAPSLDLDVHAVQAGGPEPQRSPIQGRGAPTKTAGRLVFATLAWVFLVPQVRFLCLWLGWSVFDSDEGMRVTSYAADGIRILLAALLYWYCVPRAPDWARRVAYFVGFALLLTVAGPLANLGVTLVLGTLMSWR